MYLMYERIYSLNGVFNVQCSMSKTKDDYLEIRLKL